MHAYPVLQRESFEERPILFLKLWTPQRIGDFCLSNGFIYEKDCYVARSKECEGDYGKDGCKDCLKHYLAVIKQLRAYILHVDKRSKYHRSVLLDQKSNA